MGRLIYDYKAVGERIRKRRKELSLSQAELAERINRVPKYCADIERGSCGMSIETMLSFCSALQISPTTLLLGAAYLPEQSSNTLNQITSLLAECTEERRSDILEIIQLILKK